MVASGNAIVCNPHPSGANCAAHRGSRIQQSDRRQVRHRPSDHLRRSRRRWKRPTQIFKHRGIPLLVVTGGPQVARAALAAKKRAIVAGPGNPPVVVDETACLKNAAESIVKGAAYDNNLLCIGEKQVFCVESVFDKLMQQMERAGGFILNSSADRSADQASLPRRPARPRLHVNKDFVGRDAAVLAQAAGVRVPPATQLLVGETDANHLFVQEEQMMPFVPFVRVKNVDEAMELAIQSEHGYRHTAIIHSPKSRHDHEIRTHGERHALRRQRRQPRRAGSRRPGISQLYIATPTGEGITTPLTFTRYRRIMMTGSMRMI